jgi:aspartate kinase
LKDLLVMKFGGTSLGSAERFRVAARLIAQEAVGRPVAVVASAMSGVTDLLLDTFRNAETGDRAAVEANLEALRARHSEACRQLLPTIRQEAANTRLGQLVDEFEQIVMGVIAMHSQAPLCTIDEGLAIGERLSVALAAEHLTATGTPAEAVNARDVIVTDALFGNAAPRIRATRARAFARISPLLQRGITPVMTGFNGATADGRATTLGRGGSDFSAAILAAALDAAELWIWSDVDGILSADPKLVSDAQVLSEMTYAEAAELAGHGAKVLHPRTLAPLIDKRIPVRCKNSFAPEKPGTRIVSKTAHGNGFLAVTSLANLVLMTVETNDLDLSRIESPEQPLNPITRVNVEALPFTLECHTGQSKLLVRSEEFEGIARALESSPGSRYARSCPQSLHADRDVALVAVVGRDMGDKCAFTRRISTVISHVGVSIIGTLQDSGELTIALVVRRDGLERAVRAVHNECRYGIGITQTKADLSCRRTGGVGLVAGNGTLSHTASMEETDLNL